MAYKRKTRDRWDIMTNWGTGWECEDRAYTYQEARELLRDYAENSCGRYAVKLEKHREKNPET